MAKTITTKKELYFLMGIFILALVLRFLYYPNNIYFGFDQARDAFAALAILKGDLRIVGPPTGVEGWFHGPLYYYIYAPIYYLSSGDPESVAAFLRIMNAAAVFVVFLISTVVFNKWAGLLAALFFAFSFEQTQYALYFNHPSFAVVSILLFYLGLVLLFFKKNPWGLILALGGLGLSVQFEFVLVYLLIPLGSLLLIFRKNLPKLSSKIIIIALSVFIITILTFILTEIKFQFRSVATLSYLISQVGSSGLTSEKILSNIYLIAHRLVGDNLLLHDNLTSGLLIFIGLIILSLLKNKLYRPKAIFLVVWFLAGTVPYFKNSSLTPLYYYSVGASVSLIIFWGFLTSKVWEKSKLASVLLIIVPLISNLILINSYNPKGSIGTINVQSGMLLSDEKKVIDYIYKEASDRQFAVSSVSMPLYVNTTWSYLFEWYGKSKYGFLPVWGGEGAAGYPGNLKIITARSALPQIGFFIIEPTRGIRPALIEKMLREESYFTKVYSEEKIGGFVIQKRYPI